MATANNGSPDAMDLGVVNEGFTEGDLEHLSRLYMQADAIFERFDTVVAQMAYVTRALRESIKRAEELRRPRYIPAPVTRIDGRPTVEAAGPKRVLAKLAERPDGMTMEELSEATGYCASTVRTYLPTLRRNNLIHATELRIVA